MISILLPSRNRPENVKRLWDSIVDTTEDLNDIEMIVAVDNDDPQLEAYVKLSKAEPIHLIIMDRTVLSIYWNRCQKKAKGPIYMHAGDDIIFRTKGWDAQVKAAFDEYEDKIVFVHGDDGGGNGQNFGTHGFIHKNWVNAVGYFVPPYFSSDYNDTWLNDVSNMLSRRKYVDILTEHMHPAFGKGPMDITHEERLTRHRTDGVDAMYSNKAEERIQDSNKLREVMQ